MSLYQNSLPSPKQIFMKVDRVWLSLAILCAAVALFLPDQIEASVQFVGLALIDIALFLFLAIFCAAYAMASGADSLVARAFTGQLGMMVMLGALFGALSPFCSCGVIPLIAAALSMGVHLAPVMAFWLASPLMDPTMFMLTTGELGLEFALAKTAAAIGMGLMGGYVTLALSQKGLLDNPLREGVGAGGCCAQKQLKTSDVQWAFWQEPARREKFIQEGLATGLFLLKWLMIAYLLESLMVTYVPGEWIAQNVGQDSFLSILSAALIGVPAYLNGYAAVPLISGLLENGMAAGAGMAFLIAGGVTSIPAAIAVFALARLQVFALYIGYSLSGAVIAGLLFQYVQ